MIKILRTLIITLLFATAVFGNDRFWFMGDPAVTTYKFFIMNPANGMIFNPVMGDFEASSGLTWADRSFAVTEDPCNMGYYYAPGNDEVPTGFYIMRIYDSIDGTLSYDDTWVGDVELNWNNNTVGEVSLVSLVTIGSDVDTIKNGNDLISNRVGTLYNDLINGGRLDLLIDSILADTTELQTDWADGGRLDLLVDSIFADTNELQGDLTNGGRLDSLLDVIAERVLNLWSNP